MNKRKKYKSPKIISHRLNEPEVPYTQPLSAQDVWKMFQDVADRFKETDKQFKEITERFKNNERERSIDDSRWEESKMQFKETDKKLKQLSELFTSQWGKLMESLVEGDLIQLLNARGIKVHRTQQRIESKQPGPAYEFDILAENGLELVFVEVKTTMKTGDVKHFLQKLEKVKTWMPRYKDMTVYGAVAYLRADKSCIQMAENKGLFVIRATGKSASIINSEDFRPKPF